MQKVPTEKDNVLRCAICSWRMQKGLDICAWCWKEYQEYIQQKPAWLREMRNYAQRERRRMEREYTNISLELLQEIYEPPQPEDIWR